MSTATRSAKASRDSANRSESAGAARDVMQQRRDMKFSADEISAHTLMAERLSRKSDSDERPSVTVEWQMAISGGIPTDARDLSRVYQVRVEIPADLCYCIIEGNTAKELHGELAACLDQQAACLERVAHWLRIYATCYREGSAGMA